MLKVLDEFRKRLDDIMLQAMHKRVLLYGYGYSGRFLKWYARYYHSIEVDYLVSLDSRSGQIYDQEIFRTTLFSFNYKDVDKAVVWVTEPMDKDLEMFLEQRGYIRNETYFDIYGELYRNEDRAYIMGGGANIQFLTWLEWKYQCDFVSAIDSKYFEYAGEHGSSYKVTTQKEIFPILDKCHCIPTADDAIFDYGCGKGGALVSFLDYGFSRVGGVEYEKRIYDVLVDNMTKLKLMDNENIECIYGDAMNIDEQLDEYNWFYFFQPFDGFIFKGCMDAICRSLIRCNRKVHLISLAPNNYQCIEAAGGGVFRLTNQFTIDSKQRVVNVYINAS